VTGGTARWPGHSCPLCSEEIRDGDDVRPSVAISGTLETPRLAVVTLHRECLLLESVGHEVGLCACTGYAGMSLREAALEADRRLRLAGTGLVRIGGW
jgi:hypothetical protein